MWTDVNTEEKPPDVAYFLYITLDEPYITLWRKYGLIKK